jgi:hypothetical protein
MITQATKLQRVYDLTTLNHGDYVRLDLKGHTIEGQISREAATRYYICSNNPIANGSYTENKLGYLYSWTFDPTKATSREEIQNVYLLKNAPKAKRVPPSKRTLATSYYLDKRDVALVIKKLKDSVPRRETNLTKRYFNLTIEGNRYAVRDNYLLIPQCDTPYQVRLNFRYHYKHSKTLEKQSTYSLSTASYEVLTFEVKPLAGKHGEIKATYKPSDRALLYLAIKDLTLPKTIKSTAEDILKQLDAIYPNAKLERTGF